MQATAPRLLGGLVLAAALVFAAAPAEAADSPPAWMLAIKNQPQNVAAGDSTSVVLLDETVVTIGTGGRRVTRQREVVRILKREGRDAAVARIAYAVKNDKLGALQAWLIKSDGRTRTFGRKDVVEIATSLDALYADTRAAIIDVSSEADAGCVFGWEGTLDELSTLGQGHHWLQGTTPVALARIAVRVPKDWKLDARIRGQDPVVPTINGDTYTWEFRDLPAFKQEPFGPGPIGAALHLVYDLRPPKPQSTLRTFDTWANTSAYALELHNKPAQTDPTVKAKARELAATAPTPWDKIRILGTYAQKLRYVAIAMNLGTGGGYTPHPAAEVLRCGYGDCKDKTTLLRALLAAEGIRAWPVLAFSGDPTSVRDDWPSPVQFNHVFTAIELGDAVVPDSTFVVDVPGAGRVLLFDPTDPDCRIGDFPDYNQGSHVLVCTPATTGLTAVPIAAPERNHVRRRVKVGIEANGVARVGGYEVFSGAAAAETRSDYENETKLKESFEKRLLTAHPAAVLTRTELGTAAEGEQMTLRWGFGAPRFCRVIRDQLLVFLPVVRTSEAPDPLPPGPRTHAIVLPSMSTDDSTEFLLPEGFRISELPKPVVLEREFARYELTLTAGEKSITARRQRTLRGGVHPAADYDDIRGFFEAVRKAENTPIVLERIPAS